MIVKAHLARIARIKGAPTTSPIVVHAPVTPAQWTRYRHLETAYRNGWFNGISLAIQRIKTGASVADAACGESEQECAAIAHGMGIGYADYMRAWRAQREGDRE